MRRTIASGLVVLASVWACPWAYGESPQGGEAGEGWTFSITPYLWAVGLDGDMTVKGVPSSVSVDFGDILSNLDIALEAHLEAWKGDWGLMLDGTYVDLNIDAKSGPLVINMDPKITLVDYGGLYRVARWPHADGEHETDLALLLGGRYTRLDVTLTPKSVPAPPVSQKVSWTDLIVGARLGVELTDAWTLLLRGDVGGFGIDSSSDFTGNASALAGWRFSPNWRMHMGYRVLYQDYSKGSGANLFKYDMTTHGPIVGVEYDF